MKKNDFILIIVVLAITAVVVVGMKIWQQNNTGSQATVVVTIDGEEYGTFPLNKDVEETIEFPDGSYNKLVISEGYASVSEASCRDQICVNHMHIHYSGETIVCLPNKLVIEIINGEESDIDGATH
jgi:hypothetical protein